jgi:hypothetical protein
MYRCRNNKHETFCHQNSRIASTTPSRERSYQQDLLCPNNVHEKNGSANDVQRTHPLPVDRKRQQKSQKSNESVIRNTNEERGSMLMQGTHLRPIPMPTAAVAPNSFRK